MSIIAVPPGWTQIGQIDHHKLRYRIVGRDPLIVRQLPGFTGFGPCSPGAVPGPDLEMESVHIEWTHEDGFPPDMRDHARRYTEIELILGHALRWMVEKEMLGGDLPQAILDNLKTIYPQVPHSREHGIISVPDGERPTIMDQFNVRAGLPDSIIMQMCEEKRFALARALKVEP